MNKILVIQLVSSFFVGGGFMAFLSFLAERADERVSGIIIMLPSTLILGFFFLGWAISPQAVANIIPATLIPLGLVVFSVAIYIYTACLFSRLNWPKLAQVIMTLIVGTIVWLVLSVPFAVMQFTDLYLGIGGYFALTILTYYLLHRYKGSVGIKAPEYTVTQKLLRAAFMGSLIAFIVYLGKTLNPFWGGIFTMFPAATFSALVFFHFYYSPKKLFSIMRKAPIGSLSLLLYTLVVMVSFPRVGFILGTVIATMVSLPFSFFLTRVLVRKAMR